MAPDLGLKPRALSLGLAAVPVPFPRWFGRLLSLQRLVVEQGDVLHVAALAGPSLFKRGVLHEHSSAAEDSIQNGT